MLNFFKYMNEKRKIKSFWRSEVESIFYFFNSIKKIIEPEELSKAENIAYDILNIDNEIIDEINRICKISLSDIGFDISRDIVEIKMLYNKANEKYLFLAIINKSWNENYHFYQVYEYPKFKFEITTIYDDGLYHRYGGEQYNIKNSLKPIKVLFPLTDLNKKKLINDLIDERA